MSRIDYVAGNIKCDKPVSKCFLGIDMGHKVDKSVAPYPGDPESTYTWWYEAHGSTYTQNEYAGNRVQ